MLNVYYESRSQGTPKEIHMEFLGLLGVDSQGMPDVLRSLARSSSKTRLEIWRGSCCTSPRFFFVVNPATYNVAFRAKPETYDSVLRRIRRLTALLHMHMLELLLLLGELTQRGVHDVRQACTVAWSYHYEKHICAQCADSMN